MRHFSSCLTGLMALLALTASAAAHDDVVPYVFGGKLLTGGHNDTLGTSTLEQRVFGFDFGEEPSDPFFIGDPGFNNGAGFTVGVFPNNGLLPLSSTLAFSVITPLQYWDGSGSVSFAAAAAGIELGLKRGSNTLWVTASGQSGTAPNIGNTGAAGRLHVHLESLLSYTDGVDPTPPNAPDGLYLIGLQLRLPGTLIADSEPIYFVYNNAVSEEVHDAAIAWVEAHLVPEPSSVALAFLGAGALVCARLRRRWMR